MTTEVHPISTISDNGVPPYFSWMCSCGKRVGGYHTRLRAFTVGEQHVEDAHPGALRQWRANESAGLEQLRAELESVRADRDRLAEALEQTFPKTWAGFEAFLREQYPEDIIPDDTAGMGPAMVRAARALARVELDRDRLAATVDRSTAHVERLRELADGWVKNGQKRGIRHMISAGQILGERLDALSAPEEGSNDE